MSLRERLTSSALARLVEAEVGVLAQSDLSAESGTDGIGPN
ncbi:hypothetical protein [Brachybacterium nesterenkovii]